MLLTIFSGKVCEIAPCGAHEYYSLDGYANLFGKDFYASADHVKDKSGCIYQDFPTRETARCMESVNPNEVIEKIRDYLNKN